MITPVLTHHANITFKTIQGKWIKLSERKVLIDTLDQRFNSLSNVKEACKSQEMEQFKYSKWIFSM